MWFAGLSLTLLGVEIMLLPMSQVDRRMVGIFLLSFLPFLTTYLEHCPFELVVLEVPTLSKEELGRVGCILCSVQERICLPWWWIRTSRGYFLLSDFRQKRYVVISFLYFLGFLFF